MSSRDRLGMLELPCCETSVAESIWLSPVFGLAARSSRVTPVASGSMPKPKDSSAMLSPTGRAVVLSRRTSSSRLPALRLESIEPVPVIVTPCWVS